MLLVGLLSVLLLIALFRIGVSAGCEFVSDVTGDKSRGCLVWIGAPLIAVDYGAPSINVIWESAMHSLYFRVLLLATMVMLAVSQELVIADVTPQERRSLRALKTRITKAGNLYKQKKFKECGVLVVESQQQIEKLAASKDKQLWAQLSFQYKRLVKAHALLELEGIELKPLKKLEAMSASEPDQKEAISFKEQVAVILVSRCGRCHVNNTRGMFSMADFESLMKGPPAGFVIKPGDVAGSRLIEAVEGKEMPPSGAGIPEKELVVLKNWVKQGAKYDGKDPQIKLTTLAPDANAGRRPEVKVVQSTGKESVHFATDLAAMLEKQCGGCHGNGRRASGGFNLTTFRGLMRGGDSGAAVLPGKSNDSLLVRKLKGLAGDRMPLRRPALTKEVIEKIETWIKEGATFDGEDATRHIRDVAALARAKNATHEELSTDRMTLAAKNWRLGMPDGELAQVETKNFLLLGDVPQGTLEEVAKTSESVVTRVAEIFKVDQESPLIKGRMTLFVFQKRYDYSEFGKMVEERQLPRSWRGHWKFTVVDAYGALVRPRLDDDQVSLDVLIAQQVAGAFVASHGKVPRWFSEGTARFVAWRMGAKDERVLAWDRELVETLNVMKREDDFLKGKLPAELADVASYSFVKFLMKDPRRYQLMLKSVGSGIEFQKAFATVYQGTPEQVAKFWVPDAAKQASRVRRSRRSSGGSD